MLLDLGYVRLLGTATCVYMLSMCINCSDRQLIILQSERNNRIGRGRWARVVDALAKTSTAIIVSTSNTY